MKIGIDFGTSFSLPAVMHFGNPQLLLMGGIYGVPSVFYYDKLEGILIGQEAEDAGQGVQSVNMCREIKMDLFSNFIADGRTFNSSEIIGHILSKVADAAMHAAAQKIITNNVIDGVVITVPVAFEHNEKNFINNAAKQSPFAGGKGLNVLGLIKEPVAAAIAYFHAAALPDNTNILVYDLGGGTCDIAVVKSKSECAEKYEVVAAEMIRVGGREWDNRLIEYITEKLEEKTGLQDLRSNPDFSDKVRRAAVDVKHRLSTNLQATARVEVNGRVHSIRITRDEFNNMTEKLLSDTIKLAEQVAVSENTGKIDYIVCVGGSSNMPQVETAIEKAFPGTILKLYEPEKAIAYGAAIYADWLDNKSSNVYDELILDRSEYSYGVEYWYDYGTPNERLLVKNLIVKGDKLPVTNISYSNPIEDGQTSSLYQIFESVWVADDPYSCENGKLIGEITISHEDAKTTDRTKVTMVLNKSGLLEVEAIDMKTNMSKKIQIELKYEHK